MASFAVRFCAFFLHKRARKGELTFHGLEQLGPGVIVLPAYRSRRQLREEQDCLFSLYAFIYLLYLETCVDAQWPEGLFELPDRALHLLLGLASR